MDTRDADIALNTIWVAMEIAQDDADTIYKKSIDDVEVLDEDMYFLAEDVEVSYEEMKQLAQRIERMEKEYISNVYFCPLESFLAEAPHSKSELS